MVAAERQSGNDGFGRSAGHDGFVGQGISQNAIIDLGVKRSLVHADARAAFATALDGFAKALIHVGPSCAALVLQCYEETAGMRRVVAVVPARPRVDVKNSARRCNHVASVTNALREDRRTKTRGQRQAGVIVRAGLALGFRSGVRWFVRRGQ